MVKFIDLLVCVLVQFIDVLICLDLSIVEKYVDKFMEPLMSDIRSTLKLVIPDYFGFNVVHYDPLKEQQLPTIEDESMEEVNGML